MRTFIAITPASVRNTLKEADLPMFSQFKGQVLGLKKYAFGYYIMQDDGKIMVGYVHAATVPPEIRDIILPSRLRSAQDILAGAGYTVTMGTVAVFMDTHPVLHVTI